MTEGTETTNPHIAITSENSASVIGRLESGDFEIQVTAYDDAGGSDTVTFSVTTINANGVTGDNTVTPDMASISAVELTDEIRRKIADAYREYEGNVYSLYLEDGVTIDDSTRELTERDQESLSNYSARMLYALPRMTVSKSGVYVWGTTLRGYTSAGANIQCLYNMGGRYMPFNRDGDLLEEDYDSEYFIVPDDLYVMRAAYLEADQTYWAYVVVPADGSEELPVMVVEPIAYLSPDVIQNITRTMEVDSADIKLLTAENLSDPVEPNKAMRDEAAKDRYSFIYKLDTITVDEDGYYAFYVNIPDELLSATNTRFYGFERDVFQGSSVNAAILPGLINGVGTMLEFNMMGIRTDSLLSKILVVGFFHAGKPLCLFLARLLLSVLLGGLGCNMAGAGIIALGTAGIFIILRHRKINRK